MSKIRDLIFSTSEYAQKIHIQENAVLNQVSVQIIQKTRPELIVHIGTFSDALLCVDVLKDNNFGELIFVANAVNPLKDLDDIEYLVRKNTMPNVYEHYINEIQRRGLDDIVTVLNADCDMVSRLLEQKNIIPDIVMMDTYFDEIHPNIFIRNKDYHTIIIQNLTDNILPMNSLLVQDLSAMNMILQHQTLIASYHTDPILGALSHTHIDLSHQPHTLQHNQVEETVLETIAEEIHTEETVVEPPAQEIHTQETIGEAIAEDIQTEETIVEAVAKDIQTEETIVEAVTEDIQTEETIIEIAVQEIQEATQTTEETNILSDEQHQRLLERAKRREERIQKLLEEQIQTEKQIQESLDNNMAVSISDAPAPVTVTQETPQSEPHTDTQLKSDSVVPALEDSSSEITRSQVTAPVREPITPQMDKESVKAALLSRLSKDNIQQEILNAARSAILARTAKASEG